MDVGQFVIEYARQNGPDGSFARDVDLVTAAIAQDRIGRGEVSMAVAENEYVWGTIDAITILKERLAQGGK